MATSAEEAAWVATLDDVQLASEVAEAEHEVAVLRGMLEERAVGLETGDIFELLEHPWDALDPPQQSVPVQGDVRTFDWPGACAEAAFKVHRPRGAANSGRGRRGLTRWQPCTRTSSST